MLHCHALYILILVILNQFITIYGSSGDHNHEFRRCVFKQCLPNCDPLLNITWIRHAVLQWNCIDECQYICMQHREQQKYIELFRINKQINENNSTNSELLHLLKKKKYYEPEKYYGHWPYIQIFNIQEPAACIFSILNILPHLYFLFYRIPQLKSILKVNSHHSNRKYKSDYMFDFISWYPFVGINAWVCSAIYHLRKIEITAHLDFVGALILLYYALICALRHTWGTYVHMSYVQQSKMGSSIDDQRSVTITVFLMISACLLGFQIMRMYFGLVSFNEHMSLCISLAVLHTCCWLFWVYMQCVHLAKEEQLKIEKEKTSIAHGVNYTTIHSNNNLVDINVKTSLTTHCFDVLMQLPIHKWLCLFSQIYFTVAALTLEVYDFPPIYTHYDAHSLWHAATIPLGYIWYIFWELELMEK